MLRDEPRFTNRQQWRDEQMDRLIALAAIQNWLAFDRPDRPERARHVNCSVPDCKVTADLINDTIRVMAGVPNVVYMCRNHYIGTWLNDQWEVRESYES